MSNYSLAGLFLRAQAFSLPQAFIPPAISLSPLSSPSSLFPKSTSRCNDLSVRIYHKSLSTGGQYIFKIRDMHIKHRSPIVRISPDELNVNRISFLSELMPASGHRRDKHPRHTRKFGGAQATALPKPMMVEKMKKLLNRLEGFQETGEPISLLPMFGALTNDLVSEHTFGFSPDWLEAPSFNQPFFDSVKK